MFLSIRPEPGAPVKTPQQELAPASSEPPVALAFLFVEEPLP